MHYASYHANPYTCLYAFNCARNYSSQNTIIQFIMLVIVSWAVTKNDLNHPNTKAFTWIFCKYFHFICINQKMSDWMFIEQ